MRTDVRVRAPELVGRRWLNTGGHDLSLSELRGRVVLLDFWTFCCVNCLHVLDELRPVEERFPEELVVIGVHSPKFEHEGEPAAVEAAVERYAVGHAVLDDPELVTWQAYTARAWPTLVIVDPEGYLVASMSGEGHAPGIASLVEELVAEHAAKGTLRRGNAPYAPPPLQQSALRFPGKVALLPDGSFVVSDTAHHQVVQLEADLETERRRWGGPGVFDEPQGVLLLPTEVAARVGYDVLVADSVNHQVKGISLSHNEICTVAGSGRPLRRREGGGPALEQDLSTPWDLAWCDGRVVIAMAGIHQLWALTVDADPALGRLEVLAGTTQEGLRDGPGDAAWLAQPSGLATSADGERVWVADAETSALRSWSASGLTTQVGAGLFDFGHRDGPAGQARFQHPLGVVELPDGSAAVCDTYNGAIRRYDPVANRVTTLATALAEPSDAVVERGTDGSARLVVVESASHRLVRVAIPADAQEVDGPVRRTQRPPTSLAPGVVELVVAFKPPSGQKLDDRWGDPARLVVSASPPDLLLDGAGDGASLTRPLTVATGIPAGTLHVSVQAAACDTNDENPACHLFQQDWGIPLLLDDTGPDRLVLHLRGT
ncbi:MAG TPA: NHL domain-containing thioredoxin family protein [Lapillicoccus sp.]|nr:NHL domain-containing thioredoxin family protein [Lapillicoccus sp.]